MENTTLVTPGKRVEIVKLCNNEPNYQKGDHGLVNKIDDANQIHVQWDKRGSIALLPEDKFNYWLENKDIIKKVKENFKKKRATWNVHIATFYDFDKAYDMAAQILDSLSNEFSPEEKEKYQFNKLVVSSVNQVGMEERYQINAFYK